MSQNKTKSLTIFKSDRHEDIAAISLAAIIVIAVLLYMAFIAPTVNVTADSDGTLVSLAVVEGAMVKKDDPIYVISVTEKKWKDNEVEEVVKEKTILAKANGKVLKVKAATGDSMKKGITSILELEHEKGTLP